MKIKIRPYPNFKISEEAFQRDIVSNSLRKGDSVNLSNQLVMITEFKSGARRVIKARPVKYQNKLYVTAFPNPVHLFLSVAIDHYNQSEPSKRQIFQNVVNKLVRTYIFWILKKMEHMTVTIIL